MDERAVFEAAADAFSGLVDRLPDDCWERPGLGSWDVRALTGHASRALITVSTYLQRPAAAEVVTSPEQYYLHVARMLAPDERDAVDERGRQAGRALGDDPAAVVRSLVDDVMQNLEGVGDPLVETIVGGMRLSRYLPTRTFELAVHSHDIARATGTAFELPDAVLDDALLLAVQIARARRDGLLVLEALTGRSRLPLEFSVV